MDLEKMWLAILSEWPAAISSAVAFIAVAMAWINGHSQRAQTRWLETYKARFNYQFQRLEKIQGIWETVIERRNYQLSEEDYLSGTDDSNHAFLLRTVSTITGNLHILYRAFQKCTHLMDADISAKIRRELKDFRPDLHTLNLMECELKSPVNLTEYKVLTDKYDRIEKKMVMLENIVGNLVEIQLLRINMELQEGTQLRSTARIKSILQRLGQRKKSKPASDQKLNNEKSLPIQQNGQA